MKDTKKKRVRGEAIVTVAIALAMLTGAALGSWITWSLMKETKVHAIEKSDGISDGFFSKAVDMVHPEDKADELRASKPILTDEITDHLVGVCEITAYCTCIKCCGVWSEEHPKWEGTGYVQKTASGTIPTEGRTVAVDPSVIPMGATVIINGVSYVAEDTGSKVKGNVVDVYFESHEDAREFGRQTAVVHYVY
jgi:3D (Asp-Asp-Asp) domain-containing protein